MDIPTERAPMTGDLARVRLLQLVSPVLPTGAYAYSQGLESSVDRGWVGSEETLVDWCEGLLESALAGVDLPILARLIHAWREGDQAGVLAWSRQLMAMRETAELRMDDRERGQALARLLRDLDVPRAASWTTEADCTFAASFALAADEWGVPLAEALTGYAWSWLENTVIVGVKLIPLGQVAGQRVLLRLAPKIPAAVSAALQLGDDELGATATALAIASARHEHQYTRLYRS